MVKEHGLQKPIVVTDAKNLDFQIPDQKLGSTEFCSKLGNDNVLSGWRVKAQTEIKLKISEWAQHFAISGRPKNDPSELRIPTLAIKNTELDKEISIPKVLKDLDWTYMCLKIGNESVLDECEGIIEMGMSQGLNKNWDARRHILSKPEETSEEEKAKPTQTDAIKTRGKHRC